MTDGEYQALADKALHRLEGAFADVDPDDVDCERAGDVITLTFKARRKCVINTQRPTRQIWLAANARAWHFSYDETTATWLDDKTHQAELFATVQSIVKDTTALTLSI